MDLDKDSRIILSHIQRIEKKALEKRFGRFSDEEWEKIVAHVLDNIDRPNKETEH